MRGKDISLKEHWYEKCQHDFNSKKYIWDEHGYGYSTRLVRCPQCGELVVAEVVEDYCIEMLGDVGMDPRYYL